MNVRPDSRVDFINAKNLTTIISLLMNVRHNRGDTLRGTEYQ